MPDILLSTVPNVHLVSVGDWECMTGIFHCTTETLAAIIEAQDDPGVRTPVIKLGHVDPRFDGEPAVGRVVNMYLSDDGMDLYGDLVGVPKWLAEIMEGAFPSRSVEVTEPYTGATGHTHDAVMTALSLLGVSVPAIESLDDIRTLFEGDDALIAASAGNASRSTRHVMLRKVTPMPKESLASRVRSMLAARKQRKHSAAVNVSTIRDEFYENLPAGSWAWIREIWAGTDAFIIVDDDDGDLWRIPWTEDTDGDVQFGEPERVAVQYVPAPLDDESDDTMIMLARFSQSVPTKPEGGRRMEMSTLLASLGLAEDADDETIDARVAEINASKDTPEVDDDKPPTAIVPDGAVLVDAEQFAALSRDAAAGADAAKRLAGQERDRVIDGAIRAGKFPPARREHYVTLWEADEIGTRETIDKLSAGLIPVNTSADGHADSFETASNDALYASLFGAEGK